MTIAPVKPEIKLESWPVAPELPAQPKRTYKKRDPHEDDPRIRIIHYARNLIARPRGWTKHQEENKQGAVCMTGALNRARRDLSIPWSFEQGNSGRLVSLAIYELYGYHGAIEDFNDSSRTRKYMVLKAFDRAAELFYEGK